MPIFVHALNLRDDPRLVEQYIEHHRQVWPEVLDSIRATGVQNIKIYLSGRRLIMVVIGPEGFDPERAFADYQHHPVVQQWEALMRRFQEQLPEAAPGQWWMPIPLIFDLCEAKNATRESSNDGQ